MCGEWVVGVQMEIGIWKGGGIVVQEREEVQSGQGMEENCFSQGDGLLQGFLQFFVFYIFLFLFDFLFLFFSRFDIRRRQRWVSFFRLQMFMDCWLYWVLYFCRMFNTVFLGGKDGYFSWFLGVVFMLVVKFQGECFWMRFLEEF